MGEEGKVGTVGQCIITRATLSQVLVNARTCQAITIYFLRGRGESRRAFLTARVGQGVGVREWGAELV